MKCAIVQYGCDAGDVHNAYSHRYCFADSSPSVIPRLSPLRDETVANPGSATGRDVSSTLKTTSIIPSNFPKVFQIIYTAEEYFGQLFTMCIRKTSS